VVTVPAGLALGLPVGLSFIGTAWSGARLLGLAYAWEQATQMYRTPTWREDDIASDPATPRFELPIVRQTGDIAQV
jgi:amidase